MQLSRQFTRVPTRRLIEWVLAAIVCLAVVLGIATVAAACPNCKDALATHDEAAGGDLVSGFFWSILFMMGMPFALVASFSGYMYMLVRRARAEESRKTESEEQPPAA